MVARRSTKAQVWPWLRTRHEYFTLLVMPGQSNAAPAVAPVEKCFGSVVKTELLPSSAALSKRYGASDGRLFLVRPDGYIAFKARVEEAALLEAHLHRVLT